MKKWFEELGGITYVWAECSDGIARQIARADKGLSETELYEKAERIVAYKKHVDVLCEQLRSEFPDHQIVHGFLPCYDVDFDGEAGEYVYILKDRRRHGKYVVLKAVKID